MQQCKYKNKQSNSLNLTSEVHVMYQPVSHSFKESPFSMASLKSTVGEPTTQLNPHVLHFIFLRGVGQYLMKPTPWTQKWSGWLYLWRNSWQFFSQMQCRWSVHWQHSPLRRAACKHKSIPAPKRI